MADDAERARHVVRHLGHVLAERVQLAAAVRAGARRGVLHHIARQARGARLAHRLAPRCLGWRRCRGRFRRGGRGLGDLLFQIAEQQVELLDRAAQLLRGGAEPLAQQPGQAQLQLLVAQHLFLQARRRSHWLIVLPPLGEYPNFCV